MSLIFCPSPPQSGTWFTLRFFERLGFKIEHTGLVTRERKRLDMGVDTILHVHIFPFYYQSCAYKESWPSFGGDPVEAHVVRKDKLSIYAIQLLASMYPTVIPIRDPLASLLTRENRAPNLRHFYIVDAYVEVARRLAGLPNVFILPVDVPISYEERRDLLERMVAHCGIDVGESRINQEIKETAEKWAKENVTPNNIFEEMYRSGDIEGIKARLAEKWAEVKHLKNMSGFLSNFLGEHGYNRSKPLIW